MLMVLVTIRHMATKVTVSMDRLILAMALTQMEHQELGMVGVVAGEV